MLKVASSIKKETDADLVAHYRKTGDQQVVSELFRRYAHLVFGVCMKYLHHHENARDAALEIFEQLLVKLKAHEVTHFKSWLYSVARNHCLMQLRKQKVKVEFNEDMGVIVESSQSLHQDSGSFTEQQLVKLEQVIPALKEEQRVCITMFYLKEMSYQQIMEQTGFTFKQVKSFIQNGKRNLKIVLEQQHEFKAE